jgi:branched-chain amino acid transport system permease protein
MKAVNSSVKRKTYKIKFPLALLAIISFILVPFLIRSPYIMHVIIMCGIYIILSSSYNLLAGYTGALCLSQHAFFGVGAYAYALLMLQLRFPFPLAFILSGIIALIVSLAISYPALRLSYHSLSMCTLAFAMIVYVLALNLVWLTKGPAGIPSIPHPTILGWRVNTQTDFYFFILILDAISLIALYYILHSRVGRAFVAIREDEVLAETVGINLNKYKIISFIVAGFFAGIAGGAYASYIGFVAPDLIWTYYLILLLIFFVVGGSAVHPTFYGVIISTIVFVFVPEILRITPEFREIILGLTLIATLLFIPEGVGGALSYLRKRVLHAVQLKK